MAESKKRSNKKSFLAKINESIYRLGKLLSGETTSGTTHRSAEGRHSSGRPKTSSVRSSAKRRKSRYRSKGKKRFNLQEKLNSFFQASTKKKKPSPQKRKAQHKPPDTSAFEHLSAPTPKKEQRDSLEDYERPDAPIPSLDQDDVDETRTVIPPEITTISKEELPLQGPLNTEKPKKKSKHRRKRNLFQRIVNPTKRKKKKKKPVFPKQTGSIVLGTKEDPKIKRDRIRRYVMNGVNSLVLFILSYMIIYLVYEFTILFLGSLYGLDSVLYYYDLAFNDLSPLWTRSNIILVTFSGPFVCFLIGLWFYNLIFKKVKSSRMKAMFAIWLSFHGFNRFFGAWAAGISTDEGFGYVANWLYMNAFFQILLALVALFIMALIGYYAAPKVMETYDSKHKIKKNQKIYFILSQVTIPFAVGILIIYLLKLPNDFHYETYMLPTLAFLTIPPVFHFKAKPRRLIETSKTKRGRIAWIYFIIMIVLLIGYRFGLEGGLHFVIDIDIDISPLGDKVLY